MSDFQFEPVLDENGVAVDTSKPITALPVRFDYNGKKGYTAYFAPHELTAIEHLRLQAMRDEIAAAQQASGFLDEAEEIQELMQSVGADADGLDDAAIRALVGDANFKRILEYSQRSRFSINTAREKMMPVQIDCFGPHIVAWNVHGLEAGVDALRAHGSLAAALIPELQKAAFPTSPAAKDTDAAEATTTKPSRGKPANTSPAADSMES